MTSLDFDLVPAVTDNAKRLQNVLVTTNIIFPPLVIVQYTIYTQYTLHENCYFIAVKDIVSRQLSQQTKTEEFLILTDLKFFGTIYGMADVKSGNFSLDVETATVYYKKLFPYSQFHKWLSYGNIKPENFINREFSFTLHEDIYIRFQSFNTLQDFEKEVQNKCPFKIDIGAVFNMSPKMCRNYPQFHAVEKELVIDIDMTDYDQIRTCCSGADVCQKCWRFMVIAVKILERALRDDFGWKHILWVFSGRRGIHCWVCDESARKLSPSERGAVIDYLAILTAGDSKRCNVNHPFVKRSISIIKEEFNKLLSEQDFLGTTQQCNKILSFIADEKLKDQINLQFSKYKNSTQRWEALTAVVENSYKRGLLNFKTRNCVEDILLYLAYPRLDVNVTKGLNHLLKSPFCVHPKTGKICVPINPKVIDKFNPDTVPTINLLIDEVNEYEKKQKLIMSDANLSGNRLKDYKKTSLLKSVNIFEEFLRNLENSWKGSKIKQSDIKMEF